MPLYEYKCDRCGEVFEVMQKFADEPLTTHEGCGGEVHRLLSAPAFQFKGSGWYVTDYARGGSGSGGSSSGSEGNGAKAADSKPSSETNKSSDSKPSSSSSSSGDTKSS